MSDLQYVPKWTLSEITTGSIRVFLTHWLLVSRYISLLSNKYVPKYKHRVFMLALLFQKHISSRQCKLVCHHATKILPLLKLHHRQKAHANPKIRNYTFYVWSFFRSTGATCKKVQRGLTQPHKSSLLTALVPERFRLWARTTNLITIVSGILHRGERTWLQQPKGVVCLLVQSIPHRNTSN